MGAIEDMCGPERRIAVGGGLTRAHGGEGRRRPGQGELVKEGGRPVVEEMGVIDEHHQRTPSGLRDHRPGIASEQLTVVLPGQAAGSADDEDLSGRSRTGDGRARFRSLQLVGPDGHPAREHTSGADLVLRGRIQESGFGGAR